MRDERKELVQLGRKMFAERWPQVGVSFKDETAYINTLLDYHRVKKLAPNELGQYSESKVSVCETAKTKGRRR